MVDPTTSPIFSSVIIRRDGFKPNAIISAVGVNDNAPSATRNIATGVKTRWFAVTRALISGQLLVRAPSGHDNRRSADHILRGGAAPSAPAPSVRNPKPQ